jgi:hypothetical protein
MPPRGKGRNWEALPEEPAANLSDARARMRCMDLGANGIWKSPSSGAGDGVTFGVLQCNAHVLCGRLVRTVRLSNGTFSFETTGEHSAEVNLKRRQNSALTMAQEDLAAGSFRGTGSKPAEVHVALTLAKETELTKQGIDPLSVKDGKGGLEGACPCGLTFAPCIASYL